MKKLSHLLKWFTIVFIFRLIYLITLELQNLYYLIFKQFDNYNVVLDISFPENTNKNIIIIVTIMIISLLIYLIYNLIILIKISNSLIKEKVFIEENSQQLLTIGKSVIIFTTILILIKIPIKVKLLTNNISLDDYELYNSNSYYSGYALGSVLSKNIFLIITGIFILIIANLIKNGSLIKQENDLTI